MKSKRILLILGMHRSGTSLLASWLKACGLFIGHDLLPAHIGNSRGHFEDIRFLKLHQQAIGEKRDVKLWFGSGFNFAKTASQLINDNNISYDQWSWKDPRTCLLLQKWQTLLPEAKAIVIFRHYEQVVDSLIRRLQVINRTRKNVFISIWNTWTKRYESTAFADDCLSEWITYNKNILEYLDEKDLSEYLVVELTTLTKHDRLIHHQLVMNMGFDLLFTPLSNLFDHELIRTLPENQLAFSPDLLSQAQSIYQQLQELESKTLNWSKLTI